MIRKVLVVSMLLTAIPASAFGAENENSSQEHITCPTPTPNTIYIDRIVYVDKPVEVIKTVTVTVPVIIEKPVEVIKTVEVIKPVEVIKTVTVDVPVIQTETRIVKISNPLNVALAKKYALLLKKYKKSLAFEKKERDERKGKK